MSLRVRARTHGTAVPTLSIPPTGERNGKRLPLSLQGVYYLQRFFHNPQRLRDLVLGDVERWQEPHRVVGRGNKN